MQKSGWLVAYPHKVPLEEYCHSIFIHEYVGLSYQPMGSYHPMGLPYITINYKSYVDQVRSGQESYLVGKAFSHMATLTGTQQDMQKRKKERKRKAKDTFG